VNVLESVASGASLTFMSAYLYGVPDRLPITESSPARRTISCAIKHLAEEARRFYAADHGVRVGIARVFNVPGPARMRAS
jgi:nucleoside-diphosphate-sugar epimerase